MNITEGFLICFAVAAIYIVGAISGYSSAHNYGSDLKEECEKDLPRSQQCIMQYVPEGE